MASAVSPVPGVSSDVQDIPHSRELHSIIVLELSKAHGIQRDEEAVRHGLGVVRTWFVREQRRLAEAEKLAGRHNCEDFVPNHVEDVNDSGLNPVPLVVAGIVPATNEAKRVAKEEVFVELGAAAELTATTLRVKTSDVDIVISARASHTLTS